MLLNRRLGVEVELLAPPASDRSALAELLARRSGGSVEKFLFPDAEPSKVEGTELFHNLTTGFRVRNGNGTVLAWIVDDVTLQDDLKRSAPPRPGWWRIVSDDRRLTTLASRFVDADADLPAAIKPLAELFDAVPEQGPGGMWRIRTDGGIPVAIAAPMPGERERVAELVTAPIESDHSTALTAMLGAATDLGFGGPAEGATHLHFDAGPLREARVFRRLVQLLHPLHAQLRDAFGTNPRCRRLGPWPEALIETVEARGWDDLAWEEAAERLNEVPLTKYCDVNLRNVVNPPPGKDTIELRTLPVHLRAEPILAVATLFTGFVAWAQGDAELPVLHDLATVIRSLPTTDADLLDRLRG
jgi:hypothetical protein